MCFVCAIYKRFTLNVKQFLEPDMQKKPPNHIMHKPTLVQRPKTTTNTAVQKNGLRATSPLEGYAFGKEPSGEFNVVPAQPAGYHGSPFINKFASQSNRI